jgi:hypothetical protein
MVDYMNFYFATPHTQIGSFYEGFMDDMATLASESVQWPVMTMSPIEVVHPIHSISYFRFRFYFLDLVKNNNNNLRDVVSDQLRTASDFINWLRKDHEGAAARLNVMNTPVCYPSKSQFIDYTAGWYVDVEIEAETEDSECVIPYDGYHTPAFTFPGYSE